jgi:proteasome lid subunit RPN8/RPN11
MIQLTKELDAEIRKEGEITYPGECCGFLLGTVAANVNSTPGKSKRTVQKLIPVDNAREKDEQFHRFTIEPEDFLNAEKIARKEKLDVLGFYHSHPDHPSEPSEYDREHALPFYSYIIISVELGVADKMTSWELTEDRSKFIEEGVNICR